jgi:uncharacterized protein YlxW (UPF0749 family)
MSKRRYQRDQFARVAIERPLHQALSEAAGRVGVEGPGVMLRLLLRDLETADDVVERYRALIDAA